MAKFEVTMGIEGKNQNEVLSNVYKALYTGDLDADYVKVRPEKKRGQLVPEVNPKVAQRLLGRADAEIARITGEPNGDPDVSNAFTKNGYGSY